ncbi:MAG: MBG domain-containing protein, partial [Tannerellaceae bacterium]
MERWKSQRQAEGTLGFGDTVVVHATGKALNVEDTRTGNNPVGALQVLHEENGKQIPVTDQYDVTRIAGTLSITPRPATIRANSLSKIFGEQDPTLTATVSGTVGQDKLKYGLMRDPGEAVGTYVIHIESSIDPN